MTDAAWQSYPGAPAPGTVVAAVRDINDPGTLAVGIGEFPLLLTCRDGVVAAFVNACPHLYLPLTHRAARVLSRDGSKLICSNHDAVFDAETGMGLGGYGQGCWLDPVPVHVAAGRIVIG